MSGWMRPACPGLQASCRFRLLHFVREVFIATRSLTFGGTRSAPPDVAKE